MIAHFFHYNAFNILISWCGAFFLVNGMILIGLADQMSLVKSFLFHHGFKNDTNGGVSLTDTTLVNPNQVYMNPFMPLWITIVELCIFMLSICLKKHFER